MSQSTWTPLPLRMLFWLVRPRCRTRIDVYDPHEKLRLLRPHGVLDERRRLGQRFYVDAELTVDPGRALEDDSIAATVDYGVAFELIEKIITARAVSSSKSLALEVAKALTARFPQIVKASHHRAQAQRAGARRARSCRGDRLVGRNRPGRQRCLRQPGRQSRRSGSLHGHGAADTGRGRLHESGPRLSLYRTPPWGKTDHRISSTPPRSSRPTLSPRGLLDLCLKSSTG